MPRQTSRTACRWICAVAIVCLQHSAVAQNVLTTYAGTDWVFTGNGKSAANAPFSAMESVALDSSGRVVFADPGNAVVVRLESNGSVTVLAGNGLQRFSGDGGAAVNAALNTPLDAAYDAKGNLYIADFGNNRIRMLAPDGTIKTVAGSGGYGFTGDGGPAVNATMYSPTRIAVDAAGNIYFNDSGNGRIRKVSVDGTMSTFAGNGTYGYSGDGNLAPLASFTAVEGLAADNAGNLYFSDFFNNRIRKVDLKGVITTIAGDGQARFTGDGGPAAQASLNGPTGVFVDSGSNIYVSDADNFRIRKIDSRGTITTIAGTGKTGFSGDGGPALQATFAALFGLSVDSKGNIVVADRDNHRVRTISAQGNVSSIAGNGTFRFFSNGTPALNAFLYDPSGVSIDNKGNVYIADTDNNRIRIISAGGVVSSFAGNGTAEYSGDNGQAAVAGVAGPLSVTPDNNGNVYITDTQNSCIRKVTSAGVITTVAGMCSFYGYSGDGGLAVKALLDTPQQVAVDSAGNLYISDWYYNVIRKVTTDGRISTIAGSGVAAFHGDGGPAAAASLSGPSGILLLNGKLYIADCFNSRIRAINLTDNTITTVAGGGSQAVDTTGKPAAQVILNRPLGLAADAMGNIYFSDGFTNQILKLSSAGAVSVVAGTGKTGFSGDGGPPPQGTFNYPYGMAVDANGNLLIADASNSRVRVILTAPPTVQAAPATLSFSATSGGALSDSQSISIASSVSGLIFSVSTSDSWLKTATTGGTLPGSIQAFADPTNLQPGSYRGTITISATGASPTLVTVNLSVGSGVPPKLETGISTVSFAFASGSTASSQNVALSNTGGGTLNFTASVTAVTGGNWLTVAPSQGQVNAIAPLSITLSADPGVLKSGTYSALLNIQSDSGQSLTIPVSMGISSAAQTLLLSQAGMKFSVVAGGGQASAQRLSIANGGSGTLKWTAQTSVLATTLMDPLSGAQSDGTGWLSMTPTSGSSIGGAVDTPHSDVSVNATGLAPGEYFGKIQVSAPGAANNPQLLAVVLDVLPSGTDPGPDVQPSGLIFTGVSGSSPGSQNVAILNPSSQSTGFAVGKVTLDGQNWLVQAPSNGAATPGQSGQVVVQPDFTNLPPGIYNGVLTFAFGQGTVRTVSVLSIVTAATTTTSRLQSLSRVSPEAGSCSSPALEIQFQSPARNFVAVIGQPTNVQVQIVDDCGNQIGPSNPKAATVQAVFSNKDADLSLTHTGNGVWTGTWRPVKTQSGQATISVTAFNSTGQVYQSGQAKQTGTLIASQTPAVTSGGVQNGASFVLGAPIAPGSLITMKGVNLADGDPLTSDQPLPTLLNGTQVVMGSDLLHLLYSATGQVNVQVPYDIPVNTQFQVLVQRDAMLSVPEQLAVADAQPGVFTTDASGSGAGVIFRSDMVTLAQPASCNVPGPLTCAPATAGEAIRIYCTGLGIVTPAIDAGVPPVAPLPTTVNAVTVTIGGLDAPVTSSTLAPGQPGAYIVTATVPNGVSGDTLPVLVTVAGQTSPVVSMSVQAAQ
jgi:uncharacterized protein (TIGR03437 family)